MYHCLFLLNQRSALVPIGPYVHHESPALLISRRKRERVSITATPKVNPRSTTFVYLAVGHATEPTYPGERGSGCHDGHQHHATPRVLLQRMG